MRRHALDVLHQADRVPEDILIDALQDGPRLHTGLMKEGAIRVVDMAAAIRSSAEKLATDFKLTRHRADVGPVAHDQSLSG
jgi:hypothetical protein